jgi:hypothetical protein
MEFVNWTLDVLQAFFNFTFSLEVLPSISFGMMLVSIVVVGFILKAFL